MPKISITKVLIPKLRSLSSLKSISGSSTVSSAVINTAKAIVAIAKQIKMYGEGIKFLEKQGKRLHQAQPCTLTVAADCQVTQD